jgi:hypothetical protein
VTDDDTFSFSEVIHGAVDERRPMAVHRSTPVPPAAEGDRLPRRRRGASIEAGIEAGIGAGSIAVATTKSQLRWDRRG